MERIFKKTLWQLQICRIVPPNACEWNMISNIIKLTFYLFCIYTSLSAGCEYRSFHGGHKYIKAFRARTPYQRFFTLMQCEKDIFKNDMGKLTYLGYASVLITTCTGILVILLILYLHRIGTPGLAEAAIQLWACLGIGLGLFSLIIQGIDSLCNRFF